METVNLTRTYSPGLVDGVSDVAAAAAVKAVLGVVATETN